MKTQIIKLEPHDDTISTRDKMGWGQTGRVVLVWPDRGRILNRRLDLVLLQRHAYSQGAQMALVTTDPEVKENARDLKIPVFQDLRQAQNMRWRVTRRRRLRPQRLAPRPDLSTLRAEAHPPNPAWLDKPLTQLGFFSLGVLSFLAIVAMLLPGAKITLTPKTQLQEISLTVSASPANQAINLTGQIPAQNTTIIVEGRDHITSTGSIMVPEKFASGYVRLTNLTESEVPIPAGTILATLNRYRQEVIRFETASEGRIPAGIGKSISLPVQALLPGSIGNLPADRLVAVEGSLGLQMRVTNQLPTSGGSDRLAPSPTRENYQQLYDNLLKTLQQSALKELQTNLTPGDVPITSTLVLSNTLKKVYDPPQAKDVKPVPATMLKLTLRLEFRVMIVAGQDLQNLAIRILDANLPTGFQALPESLLVENLTPPKPGNQGTINWQIYAQRLLKATLDETKAVGIAVGLPFKQAGQALYSTLPLGSPPSIILTPTWWTRMPLLPFRISIEIK